ncbi:MAG: SET domain-containing protein-lysine N-methyltransferase, partial [Verrucomicrobiaceae bacterium]|nr:SET domain-containing protein-lysine N-methyltransferase [Verrucomicrobiaceae bacterium]
PTASFDQFLETSARVLDKNIMETHYSPERLWSEEARRQFLEPDLEPIPRHDGSSPSATLSYLSAKTIVKPSAIHGRGLFAQAEIKEGEVVAIKGGHIISRALLQELQPRLGPAEIQIGEDLFICPVTEEEREGSMIFSNHSCDPNIGVRGQIVFVAMRNIHSGEELTHDWATTDDNDEVTECRCGAAQCRRTITGKDWQRRDLQERYAGYFSAYLAEKIRKMQ